jgi:hypothetical protein
MALFTSKLTVPNLACEADQEGYFHIIEELDIKNLEGTAIVLHLKWGAVCCSIVINTYDPDYSNC